MRILCLTSVLAATLAGWQSSAQEPMQGVVVTPPPGATDWRSQHAAAELARYVRTMTGQAVRLDRNDGTGATVIALQLNAEAPVFAEITGAHAEERRRDSFLLASTDDHELTITGATPLALLYGVYHYLEQHCGVGFFWDGERIPAHTDLPVTGIHDLQVPRWPVRHFGISNTWGLDKWHHQFRTAEHRHRILDWMTKRKINRSGHAFSPTIAHSGVSAARVFGISDREPDNFTFGGWPGCLDFPAEVRTEIIRDQFQYGRDRGIGWIYYLAYGNLPHQFRELHPEYRYVDQLGYSATVLYPDDPECRRWSEAFYRDLIATYGTDHIYQDCPFVESSGADDPDASMRLKLAAAQQMCSLFRDLDEEAVWESDSWDFGALPQVWTPERIQAYFEALPREMMLVYDTAGLANPFYKRTGYFHGTDWAFGILHAFQGDAHLHGDLEHACRAIGELAGDPQAEACIGVYHVPECNGHNHLFYDLTTALAWDPDQTDLDTHLESYAARRYGVGSKATMLRALRAVVDAVYRGGGQTPIYHKLGCGYGPKSWWPVVDENAGPHAADSGSGISELERALDLALGCADEQKSNPLYENDVVEWAVTYLAHVFNYAVVSAYKAFKAGDTELLSACTELAYTGLLQIERVLSTRPDYSLQRQIDRCMAVPGVNPHLPWYMKQHCVNDLYSVNDVYEQIHWFYAPRFDVYLNELRKRAAEGKTTIAWADIAPRCEEIRARWLEGDITVPAGARFAGTPLEAVREAMDEVVPVCNRLRERGGDL